MAGDDMTPAEFAEVFRRVSEWAHVEDRLGQSPFKTRLTEHFGADPATYPVTGESVASYDLPNVQLALEAFLAEDGREHELIGFAGHVGYAEMSLAGLVRPARREAIVAETDGVKRFRTALDLLERGGSITRAMLGADGGAATDVWDSDDPEAIG